MEVNIRYIKITDPMLQTKVVYLRAEDVAAYLEELGSAEETDVRNRMHEAAAKMHEAAANLLKNYK